jgi:hypothetical protein
MKQHISVISVMHRSRLPNRCICESQIKINNNKNILCRFATLANLSDKVMWRWLSEEFSSRVAESTRLILVKDGFGGDLGALDRWTDEHRKDTKI